MFYVLRDYSVPLFMALLIHLAAFMALYTTWQPSTTEVRVIKPQIVRSHLVVLKPKARPSPVQAAKPVETSPQPEVEKPEPRIEKPKVVEQPKIDEAAQRLAREAQLSRVADAQRLERLAALADASFDQALEEETVILSSTDDAVVAASFQAGIYQLIKANWSRPPSARNGMVAKVDVELIPTGDVISVTIVESSGNAAFDRSAEAAVRKARRFIVPEDSSLFERHFRRFSLLFRPEDLLR